MSQENEKLELKRIIKIMKEDPPERKYKVTFKSMELVFEKKDYLNMLTARNVVKKSLCAERHLKDSDEITDTEVYKYLINMASKRIVDVVIDSKIKEMMAMQAMSMMMEETNDLIKGLEDEDKKPD